MRRSKAKYYAPNPLEGKEIASFVAGLFGVPTLLMPVLASSAGFHKGEPLTDEQRKAADNSYSTMQTAATVGAIGAAILIPKRHDVARSLAQGAAIGLSALWAAQRFAP